MPSGDASHVGFVLPTGRYPLPAIFSPLVFRLPLFPRTTEQRWTTSPLRHLLESYLFLSHDRPGGSVAPRSVCFVPNDDLTCASSTDLEGMRFRLHQTDLQCREGRLRPPSRRSRRNDRRDARGKTSRRRRGAGRMILRRVYVPRSLLDDRSCVSFPRMFHSFRFRNTGGVRSVHRSDLSSIPFCMDLSYGKEWKPMQGSI